MDVSKRVDMDVSKTKESLSPTEHTIISFSVVSYRRAGLQNKCLLDPDGTQQGCMCVGV